MTKICLFFIITIPAFSQELSLKQIMDDPYWIGAIPQNINFGKNQVIYFQVSRPIPLPGEWKKLDLKTGVVSACESDDLPLALARASYSGQPYVVHEIEGDLWISDGKQPRPLISKDSRLRFVRHLGNQGIAFRDGGNLFTYEWETGRLTQITDLKASEEPEEEETFYTVEEKEMFSYVENLHERDAFNKKDEKIKRHLGPLKKPRPVYLGKGMKIAEIGIRGDDRFLVDVSPSREYVAVILEPEEDGDSTEYAEFINKEGAVQAKKARPRVGHETKTWKLGIVNRDDDELGWLDLSDLPGIQNDPLAEIKAAIPEEDRKFLPKLKEGPRPVMMVSGGFQPGGNRLLVTVYTRDYKDKYIILVEPQTLQWTLLFHQHDPAWVQYFLRSIGTADYVSGAAFWRADGKRVMFLSDHPGYQHLHAYDPATEKVTALTSGSYEIFNPFEGPKGKFWYFHSNKLHPGEIHFYRMPIDGGSWTALTAEPGHHAVEMSGDQKLFVDLFSKTNQPPVIRVKRGSGAWETVYDGRSEAFKAIAWVEPQVLTYPNRDGKLVHARLYQPANPNGAGIIFVHGAGYLQNAHKGWSGYFREYMFHNLLLREGFTILDPDFQASAGYGRDWRTAIYRHMGGHDLNDIVDGARFLVSNHHLDAKRLGVYGGSYGGFITLMAMFTTPEVFQAGAALRPVTDWAYYNHWYTSRILNTPQTDPLAYRQSSPIYFAEGLQGRLLICHGMVDSNVHYQDSVRLAQKLIELRKHNWELSSYPVEGHGFRTPTGWYDEYRRIYELFRGSLLDQ